MEFKKETGIEALTGLIDKIEGSNQARKDYKEKTSSAIKSCSESNKKEGEKFLANSKENAQKLLKQNRRLKEQIIRKDMNFRKLEKTSIEMINELKVANEVLSNKVKMLYHHITDFDLSELPEDKLKAIRQIAQHIVQPKLSYDIDDPEVQKLISDYTKLISNFNAR